MRRKNVLIAIFLVLVMLAGCSDKRIAEPLVTVIETNVDKPGKDMEIHFKKGKAHNHPTMVIWVEDLEGNFIETLFITQYFGSGIFGRGSLGEGRWDTKPGRAERPSALPFWVHKRVGREGKALLPSPDQPMPDGITSATPVGDFLIHSRAIKPLPKKFRLMMEINQPWDWNEYWNNSKFPGEFNYSVSCQPALVYSVVVDSDDEVTRYYLNPIGHSHYSGLDGKLYTDLSTFTTAKDIVHTVYVKMK